MRNTTSLLMFLALLAATCNAQGAFVLRKGDLPEASIGDYRVAFTRNGAYTIARDGKWLCDAGLGFTTSGWSSFGTQVRRSERSDGWELMDGGVLHFSGTLSDTSRKPRFKFTQDVQITDTGLRFDCHIDRIVETDLMGFGVTFHAPVEHAAGTELSFRPGFEGLRLPAEHKKGHMTTVSSLASIAEFASSSARVELCGSRAMRWQALDDRKWNLNMYRMTGWDSYVTKQLNSEGEADFSYDLILVRPVTVHLDEGVVCEADSRGSCAVRDVRRVLLAVDVAERREDGQLRFQQARPGVMGEESVIVERRISGRQVSCEVALRSVPDGVLVRYEMEFDDPPAEGALPWLAISVPKEVLDGTDASDESVDVTRVRELLVHTNTGKSIRPAKQEGWECIEGSYAGQDCYVFCKKFAVAASSDRKMDATAELRLVGAVEGGDQ